MKAITYVETPKMEKNHGPPERKKIHYVKNCYNHTALISQATPNTTHTLKDLTHIFLHSKTREQERKNKIFNVYFIGILKTKALDSLL